MMKFDLCVVGAGMIGSSAARHATKLGQTVCLIGPKEPKERYGHEIFGAHYDEGRITRSTAHDLIWAVLSTRSIARYRQLEAETGIKFYHEFGCLTLGDKRGEFFINTHSSAGKQGLGVELLSPPEIRKKFPYLSIHNSDLNGMFEAKNAGYINPRRLVEVQQKLAEAGGCHIVTEIVKSVTADHHKDSHLDRFMKVVTDQGTEILARKVLLATGAFTEFRALLPPGLCLDLHPVTQAVIFAELSAEDQLKLKDMPSMIVKDNDLARNEKSKSEDDYDCYILPPIKYPNGKTYLKLGHGWALEKLLSSPTEIRNWFISPLPKNWEEILRHLLKATFPDLRPVSFYTDTCATVNTPSGRVYIDLINPQLGVALGDNGCSAKSCDEIGRLAVELILNGTWKDDLPKEAFKMIIKTKPDHSKL